MEIIAFNQIPDLFAVVGKLFVEKKRRIMRYGCSSGRWGFRPYHE